MEQLKIGVVGGRRGMTFMETLRSMGEWACLYAVCENDPLVVEARRENGYFERNQKRTFQRRTKLKRRNQNQVYRIIPKSSAVSSKASAARKFPALAIARIFP